MSEIRPGILDRDLYSAKELAIVFQVHYETILEWIKKGDLKAVNLGGPAGYRISRAAAQVLFEQRIIRR